MLSTDLDAVTGLHTHVFINSAFLPFMNKLYLANFHTSLVAFSRALNQSLGKFYVHSTAVYRYIQKHLTSPQLLKMLLGGKNDRCIRGQVTLALQGQDGPIRQSVHCCYNCCHHSASLGVLLKTEIIKMLKTCIMHL